MIQRILYSALIYLLAPFALSLEFWRSLKDGTQSRRLADRLGWVARRREQSTIWLHAASVGEVQALVPLVKRLQSERPADTLLLTTMTATGAQRVHALFGGQVEHLFLPFDLPGAVRRFIERIAPIAAIVVETELWPNLYLQLQARGIPLLLVSARMSQRSLHGYRRLDGLLRQVMAAGITVGAQSQVDGDRFVALGLPAARLEITGNIKFDINIAESVRALGAQVRQRQFGQRPVWVAGSTHAIEEEAVLDAYVEAKRKLPRLVLILAPRHPPRFSEVKALLQRRELSFVTRSSDAPVGSASVLLLDTLGELTTFYAAADVAFVGGTLVRIGGHNLLEPVAVGTPVICGPYVFNAPQIAEKLRAADALIQVDSPQALGTVVAELCADQERRRALVRNGAAVLAANRGALDRVMKLVNALLTRRSTT